MESTPVYVAHTNPDAVSKKRTRLTVETTLQYPYNAVGRLWWHSASGAKTATAIVIGGDWLLTAAHNLYDPRELNRRIVSFEVPTEIEFVLPYDPESDYKDGPYGRWRFTGIRDLRVPDGWLHVKGGRARHRYDYGLLKLEQKESQDDDGDGKGPQSVGEVVRPIPIYADTHYKKREWTAVGYSATHMFASVGRHHKSNEVGMVGKSGRLKQGASGGPWLLGEGDAAVVNGLHSQHSPSDRGESSEKIHHGEPHREWSPVFDEEFREFVTRHSGIPVLTPEDL